MERFKALLRPYLPKNTFARSVSVLVGGTASAQILMVLAAPVLTRLYTPEDFGMLAVYASLLALVGVVSSLRYELAIPLPKSDQEAAHIVGLCLFIVLGTTLLSGLGVIFFGNHISEALGVPKLASYLWLLPIGVLLSGFYKVFNFWSIRCKQFTTIAGTKLSQTLVAIVIKLTAFKIGGIALLFAQVAGQSVGTTSLARPALKKPAFKRISWQGMRKAAIRYIRFPIFSPWASLLNTAGTQAPPIMFAAFFGAETAGLYALAHRVVQIPLSVIGQAASQVFLSDGAKANQEDKLGKRVEKVLDLLIRISVPPFILLFIIGPHIFEYVFGQEWRMAGNFTRWMALFLFFQFCGSPLTVFIILERQDLTLLMQGVLFFLRLGAITAGAVTGNILFTIFLFSIFSAIGYAIFLVLKIVISGASIVFAIRSLSKTIFITMICLSPLIVIIFLDFSYWIKIFLLLLTISFLSLYYLSIKNDLAR